LGFLKRAGMLRWHSRLLRPGPVDDAERPRALLESVGRRSTQVAARARINHRLRFFGEVTTAASPKIVSPLASSRECVKPLALLRLQSALRTHRIEGRRNVF